MYHLVVSPKIYFSISSISKKKKKCKKRTNIDICCQIVWMTRLFFPPCVRVLWAPAYVCVCARGNWGSSDWRSVFSMVWVWLGMPEPLPQTSKIEMEGPVCQLIAGTKSYTAVWRAAALTLASVMRLLLADTNINWYLCKRAAGLPRSSEIWGLKCEPPTFWVQLHLVCARVFFFLFFVPHSRNMQFISGTRWVYRLSPQVGTDWKQK